MVPARPVFAAERSHSFAQFATAIDLAFARWDPAHLHLFTLADGTRVSPLEWWDGEAPGPPGRSDC
ncbi:hypothetical protein [Streptomyces sp. MS2.AVA.5]|uniref:Uncharacterized protein n=1 Tax=Streptomyces achmelvichensis TaxID=3134111 RepID=A0ACC6PKS6_9ACTN